MAEAAKLETYGKHRYVRADSTIELLEAVVRQLEDCKLLPLQSDIRLDTGRLYQIDVKEVNNG